MKPVHPAVTPRLEFANQLRGLASLSVVASHLIGVFWLMQGFLVTTTLAPAQGGPLPALVTATTVEWFQPGPFGVGLFFLISGLVVPISLEKHTALSFLAARALRIYPTYMAGLAVQVLVLLAASRIWGHPLPYDWNTILSNAFLVHDLVGRPSIDLVNWTLTIELRFYLIVALMAPWIRAGSLAALLTLAGGFCLLAILLSLSAVDVLAPDSSRLADTLSTDLPYLLLMLMGVLFNFHVRGKIGTMALLCAVVAMAGMTAFAWWFSVLRAQFTHVLINDLYALVLFAAMYAARRRIAAYRVFGALASISYPLYLIHATVGYFVMKCLMLLAGIGYLPALLAAFLTAVATATVLHWIIERPSIRWGRRLGRTPDPVGIMGARAEAPVVAAL